MDEEASFANLLSASVAPSRPSWDSPTTDEHDPWANPFASSTSTSNPFGAASTPNLASLDARPAYPSGLASFTIPPSSANSIPAIQSPREEISPYVQRLEQDRDEGVGKLPDPPSVLAAREHDREREKERDDASGVGGGVYASSAFATPTLSAPTATEIDPFNYSNPFAPGPIPSDPANAPFVPPPSSSPPASSLDPSNPHPAAPAGSRGNPRKLPSGLIDEDLMAASDPELSLKKAFVRSSPAKRGDTPGTGEGSGSGRSTPKLEVKKYVFTPKQATQVQAPASPTLKEIKEKNQASRKDSEKVVVKEEPKLERQDGKDADATKEDQRPVDGDKTAIKDGKTNGESLDQTTPSASPLAQAEPATSAPPPVTDTQTPSTPDAATPTAPRSPASVPLPMSAAPTPAFSRATTPVPVKAEPTDPATSSLATPSFDRVSVSPLDAPPDSANSDYGFKSLSIGGSTMQAPTPPAKDTWEPPRVTSPPSSRSGGKGWGAVDDDDGGLFGHGGPSVRSDPWGNHTDTDAGGWGEPGLDSLPSAAGPSRYSDTNGSNVTSPRDDGSDTGHSISNGADSAPVSTGTPTTPSRKSKLLSTPLFQIAVGDPARVGDAVRGYTVYTVKTKTTSPHYRKGDFSVLRRFSDFLWLFEALASNNPGVIVPPVPDKHAFGRFQDQFIETRRLALQRCLTKITNHPILQLDADLRLFLESDNFAIDAKHRKLEAPPPEKGLLGGWSGPKYVEQDEWFDSRRTFLDSLESQLKALSKSIETASKTRLETAQSINDFAETITALAESDLGTSLSSSLAQLSELATREKESYEEQAKSDVVHLLNMADEYVRTIGSVRAAFAGRVKSWISWQSVEKDVARLKSHREKWKAQGKLGDRAASSLAEINETERRARDLNNEFDAISKLIKSEFVRFERERVEEFKRVLEEYLDGMIARQKVLIDGWEELHKSVLGVVQRSQGEGQGQA